MATWIPCSDGFIQADVVRWAEGVFAKGRRKNARAVKTGERRVIAEVLRDGQDDGWARLLVRKCEILSQRTQRKVGSAQESDGTPIFLEIGKDTVPEPRPASAPASA